MSVLSLHSLQQLFVFEVEHGGLVGTHAGTRSKCLCGFDLLRGTLFLCITRRVGVGSSPFVGAPLPYNRRVILAIALDGEGSDVSPPRQQQFKLEIRGPWLAVRDGGRDVGDGVSMTHFGGHFQARDDVAMTVDLHSE